MKKTKLNNVLHIISNAVPFKKVDFDGALCPLGALFLIAKIQDLLV